MAQEDIFKKLVDTVKNTGTCSSHQKYMTGWQRCTITDNTVLN